MKTHMGQMNMPAHNEDIARAFEEIADLLDIEDANPFRVRAYRNAARTLHGLGEEVSRMVDDGEDLTTLPGIGEDLAKKIREMLETGRLAALDKLHRELPASLETLLRIPGLGPKRVKTLYQKLGVADIGQLEQAIKAGEVRQLPGFGEGMEHNILAAIAANRETETRYLRASVEPYANDIIQWLKKATGIGKVIIAGSYRRGKDTVGDLDMLATGKVKNNIMEHFGRFPEIDATIAMGSTRATVLLHNGIQVDLRVVSEESYGAALHYFTGNKAHNIQVRRIGQKRGLKINEYGVYKGEKRIAGKTEKSVFRAVGLPWIEPELRQGRDEIEAAYAGRLPHLVEITDLRGDLHSHTLASDGASTMRGMAMAAKRLGCEYLAITDHSRRLTVAHGLDSERLLSQIDEIDRLNEELSDIVLLKGIEVDILENGSLDLPDDILARLDLVVGAVHSAFKLSQKKQTERLLRAMDQRYFSILAHPTGRLLLQRDPYVVDMETIIEHARQRGCFLELNSQPVRLDLNESHCRMARDKGVLVSINSDAHSERDLNLPQGGVTQARRGWLEKNDVLNTRSLRELRKLLKRTMG